MKPAAYSSVQIGLHWLMALLIAACFALGVYVAALPLSPEKFRLIAWHKWAGMLVLALLLLRLAIRLWRGAPALPAQIGQAQQLAAHAAHLSLYLLMLALPLAGWLLSSARGFAVVLFGYWPLPDLVAVDPWLASVLAEVHPALAYLLLLLVLLHVAAALKHHYLDRDGLLGRMNPLRSGQR